MDTNTHPKASDQKIPDGTASAQTSGKISNKTDKHKHNLGETIIIKHPLPTQKLAEKVEHAPKSILDTNHNAKSPPQKFPSGTTPT